MSSYFDGFQKVTEIINGKPKTRIDITFAPSANIDTYSTNITDTQGVDEIGGLSLKLYNDAESFWALMFANEQLNPWELVPESPTDYNYRTINYAALSMKSTASKLNPNAYFEFKPGDIIVESINNYYIGSGITASSSLFNFDTLNFWFVDDFYNDNKKVKITQNLNTGSTGYVNDIASPDAAIGTGIYQILRRGSTGYYIYQTNIGGLGNLKTYNFLDSPVKVVKKSDNSIISTAEILDSTFDNIFTVLFDDNADPTSVVEVATKYNTQNVQTYQQSVYLEENKIKYIDQSLFSSVLNKLI